MSAPVATQLRKARITDVKGIHKLLMNTAGDDGLVLRDAYITASAHCAPPDNKPLPDERANCHAFLLRELELLTEGDLLALGL